MTYDLAPAARAVQVLLPGVTDVQLANPTPCERLDVQGLLLHLHGLSMAFRAAAEKDFGPATSTPPEESEGELPAE